MSKFYVNVCEISGTIYHRYKENGETCYSVERSYPFQLYTKSPNGDRLSIYGDKLIEHEFKNAYDTRQFAYNNGENVYGMSVPIYQFIAKEYPDDIRHDTNHINIAFFDIETEIGDKFANANTAEQPINVITFVNNKGETVCYTYYDIEGENIVKCADEREILLNIIKYINDNEIDIISGFNSKTFDMPYIIHRVGKVLGEEYIYMLSPLYDMVPVKQRDKLVVSKVDREYGDTYYDIKGLIHLDYMMLYKKYSFESLPNNKLETICQHELGEGKTDYTPYRNLKALYEADKALFVEYNIQDVLLLKKLNDKLMFIDLACVVAYFSKSNIDDVFHVTVIWDNFIHNLALSEDKIIPPKVKKEKQSYDGGYVKAITDTQKEYIALFDFMSLYPMIILQYGISPETIKQAAAPNKEEIYDDMIHLRGNKTIDKAKELGYAMAANGTMYSKDTVGVIPHSIRYVFDKRVDYKGEMKRYQIEKAKVADELSKRGLSV